VLAGSNAADTFFGQEGNDLISGNGGDDTFLSAPVRDGADFYNGGAGVDTMKYSERSGEPVTVTPDVGSENDGRAGERDTVRAEIVIGGFGPDVLDASAAPGTGYVLDGGNGDDRLLGSAGADQLFGGSGLDRMEGRAGNDFLDSLDGRQETLECGEGGDDVAKVDQSVPVNKRDVLVGCERLGNRPPASNTGSLTPRR
jgi:Ca2+-binding RTX toxin-like protein